MKLQRLACVVGSCASLALFACGSSEEDSAASSSVPGNSSVEALAAYLDAGSYKGEGWTPETTEPRDADSSHNGTVQVWLNDIATAGQAVDPDELPVDSMAVKELYDDTELVGIAALWKTDESGSANDWLFYCYGPAGRCAFSEPEHPQADPLYARGHQESCGHCHPGIITR